MKIGLSLSACVVDIIEGDVNIDDVFVIVSRTNFDPANDEHWSSLFNGYAYGGPWSRYVDRESEIRQLVQNLESSGKLHQPRKFGVYPQSIGHGVVWLDLVPEIKDIEANPALKQAWDRFNLLAGLTGTIQ